jgi:hypothetical protein
MLRRFASIFSFAIFAVACIGAGPSPLFAAEQPEHMDHATMSYNDEVVKQLLEESDPDVAFLARVKMMEGHLNAAIYAVGQNDLAEARQHIIHPVSEIVPDIVRVLDLRELKDPSAGLNAILRLIDRGKSDEIETSLYDALVEMTALEHSIDPKKLTNNKIVADTAILLLRTAVAEYAQAFKDGKIANIVEYHDGGAFMNEAATLILDNKYEWSTKNSEAFNQLELSLTELDKAWPSEIPPPNAVMPLTKMLQLASVIGSQIDIILTGHDTR